MVIRVTEKEIEHFLPFIPMNMHNEVKKGMWLCLGAVSESGEAVGVILFSSHYGMYSYIEGSDEKGKKKNSSILIHWIFVAEGFRGKGIGDELMQAFSKVIEGNPAKTVVCVVPINSDYDIVEEFFISWGFRFEITYSNELVLRKEDFLDTIPDKDDADKKIKAAANRKIKNFSSVTELSDDVFAKTVKKIKVKEKDYYDDLSENKDDYAGDLSSVILKDGEVSSIILFRRIFGNNLEILTLYGFNSDGANELLNLLRFSGGNYLINYPEDSKIFITLRNERGRKLAKYMFPDKKTIPIRKGVHDV